MEACSSSESPLLTPSHPHHSAVWCIAGYSIPKLCIACATERLENYSEGELSIHIKKILREFQALLEPSAHAYNSSTPSFFSVISSDQRVVEHLCGLLFGLLLAQDVSVAQSSLEVLMTLLGLIKSQDVSRKVLQKAVQSVMTTPNLPSSLPHLSLLGRLLHSQPQLISDVLHTYGSLLELILNALSYPDERVKSSVVYLLVQVCSKAPPNSLPLSLAQNMCRHVSANLATAKSHELTINLLGLVRHLLKSSSYTQCLLEADQLNSETKGSTVASAFKRVLLSQDELLQLSGVQCIAEVLTSHPDYGRVLLNADIAEFLFEALSSKNDLLLNSLFYCLNSLAGLQEFYSRYHVVYGMDAITTGLSTLLKLRNYSSAQIGLSLLTKVLTRQPAEISLFKTHSSLQAILNLLTPLLEVDNLTGPTVHALAALLSAHHMPQGFPMKVFLTPLAHLLSLIEPLLSPSVEPPADLWERVESVLMCVERAASLGVEGHREAVQWSEEETEFFLLAFTESLLPISLLNLDHLDRPGPFTSLLSIALILFQIISEEKINLARKLCGSGLIQLVLELKAKFPSSVKGVSELCQSGDQFLVELCVIVEGDLFPERVVYIRDVLYQALPSINCSPVDCLKILSQRSQLPSRGSQLGPPSLQSTQAAVFCLFYCAFTLQDVLVPQSDLLRALDLFLTLNPNIHLLPPSTLSHITVLYAISSDAVHTGCDGIESSDVALNRTSGAAILTRALQRVTDLDALFVPNATLLGWAVREWSGTSPTVRSWLMKWIAVVQQKPSLLEGLQGLLVASQSALECVIRLISVQDNVVVMDTRAVLTLIQKLLCTSQSSSLSVGVHDCVQAIILEQRVQPLPDDTLRGLLSLLVTAQQRNTDLLITDLKFIYHIANVLTRVDGLSDKEDHSTSHQTLLAQYAIQLLTSSLRHQTPSSQIAQLLLNNQLLLRKLSTLLPTSSNSKAHTLLSAAVLEAMALLISLCPRPHPPVKGQNATLHVTPLTSALLSTLPRVQITGLELWGVIFSREGETSPFFVQGATLKPHQRLRMLSFLLQNCLLSGNVCVSRAAADCFVHLIKYSVALEVWEKGCASSWSLTLLRYTTDVYSCSTVPPHILSSLHPILQFLPSDIEFKGHLRRTLHTLSQLLYKSLLSDTPRPNSSTSQDLSSCLLEIGKLDKSCLDESQWKTVEQNKS